MFFFTTRPETAGDSVQVQTQWWLEGHGFYLPSVLTIVGSRGEAANALRLDVIVDDQLMECADVVASSRSTALLMLRDTSQRNTSDQATANGIGVVATLEETLDVVERFRESRLSTRRGIARLAGSTTS